MGGAVAARWQGGGEPWMHPRNSAILHAEEGEDVIGVVGELHPRAAAAFDLPRGVLAFRLSLDALTARMHLVPQHRALPRFPAVLRDLAVVVDDSVTAASVEAALREEPLVEAVTLFDVYRGTPLAAGKKNLAVAIRYRAPDRTLTDAEVNAAHEKVLAQLKQLGGVTLRE